jgi:hypothetical protein
LRRGVLICAGFRGTFPRVDQGVVVEDQVSLGVLVTAVPRDAVDAAVAACGVGDRRAGGKLPAHVVAYLTMALCLFTEDDYEEVAAKVTGALSAWGCWGASWLVPTAGGISQARKRLGPEVLAEVFEQVAGPVAEPSTRGAWLGGWRLLAIDGFEVDLPDTKANAGEFGYAGSGTNRSAFPKARVVALAECGTHAFLAAEAGACSTGEKTLANPLYQRLNPDELLTGDRNFYSFDAWGLAAGTGAALLWRAPTQLELPVVTVLPDGTYLSVLIDPKIRGARRRAAIIAAARKGADLADGHCQLVRSDERWRSFSAWLRRGRLGPVGGSGCGGQPGDVVPGTEAVGHLASVFLGVEQVTTGPEVW